MGPGRKDDSQAVGLVQAMTCEGALLSQGQRHPEHSEMDRSDHAV